MQQSDVRKRNTETDFEIPTDDVLLWSRGAPGGAVWPPVELSGDAVWPPGVPGDAVWSVGVADDVVWSVDILANLYCSQFTPICQKAERHQKQTSV